MARKKITVIGAGRVGETTAHILAQKQLGDIVLVDIVANMPQGKALDLLEEKPIDGYDVGVVGTNSYEDTANSDLVILTAGLPRKPGMSRDDLIYANLDIVKTCAEQAVKYSPNAILMVISNPLDVMCYVAYKASGFPKNRVMGMAGVLDAARFRAFLALELNCSVKDVQAYVLGGHGDEMVPLIRYSSAGGVPITDLLPKEKIDAIVKRTQGAGGEIVKLLGFSAYYSPAHAAVAMAESILKDEKRILPCSCYLEGEYGTSGHFLGVTCKIGAKGVEQIFTLTLNDEEKALLAKSVEAVKATTEVAKAKL
ncbi:MAG: malate dehydrogenase [Deltaproteobacteria bacterium]|nr:malate dehydrogenase [Deltaproteobacteria bacterium]